MNKEPLGQSSIWEDISLVLDHLDKKTQYIFSTLPKYNTHTLPTTNIAAENRPFQKKQSSNFQASVFKGLCGYVMSVWETRKAAPLVCLCRFRSMDPMDGPSFLRMQAPTINFITTCASKTSTNYRCNEEWRVVSGSEQGDFFFLGGEVGVVSGSVVLSKQGGLKKKTLKKCFQKNLIHHNLHHHRCLNCHRSISLPYPA